jgi:hypothetical protein
MIKVQEVDRYKELGDYIDTASISGENLTSVVSLDLKNHLSRFGSITTEGGDAEIIWDTYLEEGLKLTMLVEPSVFSQDFMQACYSFIVRSYPNLVIVIDASDIGGNAGNIFAVITSNFIKVWRAKK